MIRGKTIWFLINLIVGLYFVNMGFSFIDLSFIAKYNNWIIAIGGILIIINGVMALRRRFER